MGHGQKNDTSDKGLYLRGETWWFAQQINGERRLESLLTKDKSEALRKAALIRLQVDRRKATLRQAADEFVKTRTQRGTWKERTAERESTLMHMIDWLGEGRPPSSITKREIQEYVDSRLPTLSAPSVVSYFNVWRAFWSWCRDVELCLESPCKKIILPDARDSDARRTFLTSDERDAFLAIATGETLTFAMIGFFSGMRKNEIIEMRWEWLTWPIKKKVGLINVQRTPNLKIKNREERTVPLNSKLERHLRKIWAEKGEPSRGYILAPEVKKGKARYRWDPRCHWMKLRKEAGHPELLVHDMRRTFASLLASNGVQIYKIAEWLGDGILVVQKHYARLIPQDDDINVL